MFVRVFVTLTKILFRVFIEGRLASRRAEVIGLSFIFGCSCDGGGVNIHVANGIMYGISHGKFPFVGWV